MGKVWRWMKPVTIAMVATGLGIAATICVGADEPSTPSVAPGGGLYVKVLLAHAVKMSKLKPGDLVEGRLSRDVYSADRKLFDAGRQVRLTVDHLERRRRTPNDHWPWVVKVFTPRHENYPVFKTATVAEAKGDRSLQVSLISVSRMRDVHAKAKTKTDKSKPNADEQGAVEVSKSNAKKPATPTMVLEASDVENSGVEDKSDSVAETEPPRPEMIPAGTQCKILLLGDVSASKSKPGDEVRARLLEPVLQDSKVILPAGSLLEGKVIKKTPPRWLSRAGSLYLTFTELTLPGGNRFPIAASLAGAELDARSHTRMDAEGRLRGERPGKAWMVINLGVSAGISKEVDDGVQLIIEAIVSTATDASTAGTSRIVASAVSGLYMVTRHGRDVVLPRFTEMEISLDRPVSVSSHVETAVGAAGGK
jgi:hypothetical protein